MDGLRRAPHGELSEIIQKFISHKRSLGYKYIIEEDNLYRFSLFSLSYPVVDKVIPSELVNDWVARVPGETFSTQRIRASSLTVFLQFASTYGYQVTLPPKLKRHVPNYVPYIFSEEEIVRLFRACDAIAPYAGTNKHLVLPVVFRVLYGCGLRVSEISNLRCQDVNLDKGILVIRNGKFGKDRIVPLSVSLNESLRRYSALVHRSRPADIWFFESKNLRPISRGWIYRQFRHILMQAGILSTSDVKSPIAADKNSPKSPA
ncbi:MAG: tyrosine-type recombinase/integrase [Alicyclobacillus sp.]|nr:tyrosine-type recombinase/integrase [Alicyclobacillus sp.]